MLDLNSRICGIVIASIALAATATATATAQQSSSPEPVFPALPAEAPAGTGIMQPCLEELEGEVRCGRYRVFEDRERRSGRTIDLAFIIADALNPKADGSSALTVFFGGPGSSVTEGAAFTIAGFEDLREHRDLLLLDFRGVGQSAALDCHVSYPRGIESRFGEIFPVDHIESCRDRLSQRAQLDLYTSAHNMDDLNELRAWLNYAKLDLIGYSYGTREVQVFLRRHPEAARTAIVNGVTPVSEPGYVHHAKGLQDALDELIEECANQSKCSSAYPNLEETVESVFERVRTDPPEVTVESSSVRLGYGEFGYALRGLLYRRGVEVPMMLERAALGDWQPLADYYVARSGWVSAEGGEAGMHFSVLCAEDISRVDDQTIARETAGTFLGDYLVGGYARVCEVWPYARLSESFFEPVKTEIPVLLFSGSRDPVTPPSGGEEVASHLPNSVHFVVPGGGHGVGGPCIAKIQRQFIETGSIEGLDSSCLEARPGTKFVLPDEKS